MSASSSPADRAQARQFRRSDETLVLVRAARQQPHHVLGADDRHQEGLEVAVQRRDEYRPAGHDERQRRSRAWQPDRAGARASPCSRPRQTGHRSQQLQFASKYAGILHAVVDGQARFGGMESRDLDHRRRQVDGRDPGACAGPAPRQTGRRHSPRRAPAHRQAGVREATQAARTGFSLVQRAELAARIPEAVREIVELGNLGRIGAWVRRWKSRRAV